MFNRLWEVVAGAPAHLLTLAKKKTIQGVAVLVATTWLARHGVVVDNSQVAVIIGQVADAAGLGFDPAHAADSFSLLGAAVGGAWAIYGRSRAQGPVPLLPPPKSGGGLPTVLNPPATP